ncbi:MAG: hypothetical protein KJN84_09305 [Bacteroidia bacterium]|nr:hypothetical protein [Bacteroidia bacterium]
MQKKKLIVTPPGPFAESNTYLDYLTKLISDKQIEVQILKSVPLIIKNPNPVNILGAGISAPHTFIQEKLMNMHEDHLKDITKYFSSQGVKVDFQIGHQSPQELLQKELDRKECLMWAVEISSDYNLWNELFGTRETELAKEINLPTLCIPSQVKFENPRTLLIVSKGNQKLDEFIPVDIINSFNLDVLLMIDVEDVNIDSLKREAAFLDLKKDLDIVKAGFIDGEDSLKLFVDSSNPSWIAYHNFDKPFIERAFNMNTTNFILSAERPVLVL